MTTLGSSSKPATAQEWWGLNSNNQHMVALTFPAGGPWLVTRLGAWLAGQGASASVRLCMWDGNGIIMSASNLFTAAGLSFALGNSIKYEADITPIQVAGGATVLVGFSRDPSDPVQFGKFGSGSHLDDVASAIAQNVVGGSWDSSGALGAYVANYQSANVAPNAPVSLSPTGNAIVNSGTAPTLSGTRSDSDGGDYITKIQIQVFEDDGVTLINDYTASKSGAPTTFSEVRPLNGAHKWVRWRARTWDKSGVAGPFSALQRFYANAVPSTPPAPTISSVSTLTPTISGSFSDSGDSLAAVQIEVTLEGGAYTSKWASGDIAKSGSSWSQAYGGSALAYATAYRARYRVKDSHGAYSSWSAWKVWTTTQPTGPDDLSPTSVNPRQSSLTPTLQIGHSAAFRNDEIEVWTFQGFGVNLWNKTWDGSDYANTTSKGRVYAGTALTYGGTYYWRARVELSTGVITEWSDWYPFRINAVPNAPTGMSPTGGAVTSDQTPDLTAFFSDPDIDQGDAADEVDIEVRNNATDALVYSETNAAPSDGNKHETNPSALTYEVTYKWRARFKDTMGLEGPWSPYHLFKVSQPPSAAGVSPTGGASVTESTPTLDWTYSSPSGKTQYSYRVRVFDAGPVGANYADEVLVWDSGETISANTSQDVPFGILVDGHDYRWEVTVKDTDMLTYVLT